MCAFILWEKDLIWGNLFTFYLDWLKKFKFFIYICKNNNKS